jgi:hypothetical protein
MVHIKIEPFIPFNLLNMKYDLVSLFCNIPFVFTFSYFITITLCCTFVLHTSCFFFLASCVFVLVLLFYVLI